MDPSLLWLCLLIFAARVCDVSLGTLRVVMVTQGRRALAAVLGFFEVFIWVMAVSKVVTNLRHPFFAVSYAAGLTHLSVWKLMLGTLAGMAPLCFAQSYLADELLTAFPLLIYPLVAACVVYGLIVIWVMINLLKR